MNYVCATVCPFSPHSLLSASLLLKQNSKKKRKEKQRIGIYFKVISLSRKLNMQFYLKKKKNQTKVIIRTFKKYLCIGTVLKKYSM